MPQYKQDEKEGVIPMNDSSRREVLADSLAKTLIWVTTTPSAMVRTLPFYLLEAGCFLADPNYIIQREYHDSYLLLYTRTGQGTLKTQGVSLLLGPESCVILDCHKPHEYCCSGKEWEFLWFHFGGSGADALYPLLYPAQVQQSMVENPLEFEEALRDLLRLAESDDMGSCVETSAQIHTLLSHLLHARLSQEQSDQKGTYEREISWAVSYIKEHYGEPITIDDMIRTLPISKFHFIRCFRRLMGVPPYSYLTTYRINMSKVLLRTTQQPVAEIGQVCGFQEASNFIAHFKKHTGLRPSAYRRVFRQEQP